MTVNLLCQLPQKNRKTLGGIFKDVELPKSVDKCEKWRKLEKRKWKRIEILTFSLNTKKFNFLSKLSDFHKDSSSFGAKINLSRFIWNFLLSFKLCDLHRTLQLRCNMNLSGISFLKLKKFELMRYEQIYNNTKHRYHFLCMVNTWLTKC